jgi:hypothetical protein
LDADQKAVGDDQIYMAAARMLYQDNKLDLAMKYYDQVPKSSDFWLEALEEKAWIYTRLDQFGGTLAEMKTILSPSLIAQVGPESYFLATLASLKVCDYTNIFKVLKEFKEHNRGRMNGLQQLADLGQTESSERALSKMESGAKTWAEIGPDVQNLPRFINRDEILSRATYRRGLAKIALNQATQLSNSSSFFSGVLSQAKTAVNNVDPTLKSRLKTLAGQDLEEMKKNLLKLQLVEAEAIHHMHVGQNVAKNITEPKPNIKDKIEFPFEEDEVWLDELDHYQAQAKGCPVEKKAEVSKRATSEGQKL